MVKVRVDFRAYILTKYNFFAKTVKTCSVVWMVDDHTYIFLTQTQMDHISYFPPSIFIPKPADKSINANYDAVAQAQ